MCKDNYAAYVSQIMPHRLLSMVRYMVAYLATMANPLEP